MKQTILFLILFFAPLHSLLGDSTQYSANPFSFPVEKPISGWGAHFFVIDLNGDDLLDYLFRSDSTLFGYDHDGSKLWELSIIYPGIIHGAKHAAADFDDNGTMEIAAINDSNQVILINGIDGSVADTLDITVGPNQIVNHVGITNFRGEGDFDILVQTTHENNVAPGYYTNRTLIAIRMDTKAELWRVEQDADPNNGYYEGYWGVGQGPFMCADVDNDGKDEIVGGNMVDDDGSVISLGYPTDWVGMAPDGYIDHLDAIGIGDFLPDQQGLEWVVTEEDWDGQSDWHVTMMSTQGVQWRKEITLFAAEREKEPQNIAVGNFDTTRTFVETWVRSRFGQDQSQHPWLYDINGNLFAHYETENTLPPGFNPDPSVGNEEGLEVIWTIDWTGSRQENIAAKSRHDDANVGVFDAVTGDTLWTTVDINPAVEASVLYVADVSGDSREEVIIYDEVDNKIKVFWNNDPYPDPSRPNKWDDPLYRRLKQNWNYYSPGSYTYGFYPIISLVTVTEETPRSATITWVTDVPATSQIQYGLSTEYGSMTAIDTVLKTDHSVTLNGLTPDTTYHYRVISKDANNKAGLSPNKNDVDTPELNMPVILEMNPLSPKGLELTWVSPTGFTSYNIYRSVNAFFVPDYAGGSNRIGHLVQDADGDRTDIQWIDTTFVSGDIDTNYFYLVTGANAGAETDSSNLVGEFDYQLVTTATTDFNEIALSISTPNIDNAEDLMAAIPGCNSVARWRAAEQGYEQYIPGIEATNFPVGDGYPYYVNVTIDTVFTLTGGVSTPTFTLVETATTDFNEIMLTLEKTDIQKASDLMADIPNCNSVARWVSTDQVYEQYIPGIEATDFDVRVGYPYFVNVTANTTWPESGGDPMVPHRFAKHRARSESSNAPHIVHGTIPVNETELSSSEFQITAYITERPNEIITQLSKGCKLWDNRWAIQISTFPSPWKAGEILRVQLRAHDGSYAKDVDVMLTYNPVDDADNSSISPKSGLPVEYSLSQNYPNPFNPETRVKYHLPKDGLVHLVIYNMMGQQIKTLVDEEKAAGIHEVVWDSRDEKGKKVASGVYILSFKTANFSRTIKLSLVQ